MKREELYKLLTDLAEKDLKFSLHFKDSDKKKFKNRINEKKIKI